MPLTSLAYHTGSGCQPSTAIVLTSLESSCPTNPTCTAPSTSNIFPAAAPLIGQIDYADQDCSTEAAALFLRADGGCYAFTVAGSFRASVTAGVGVVEKFRGAACDGDVVSRDSGIVGAGCVGSSRRVVVVGDGSATGGGALSKGAGAASSSLSPSSPAATGPSTKASAADAEAARRVVGSVVVGVVAALLVVLMISGSESD
ncbi:hypothetical protein DFJ73DRAFT_802225 [Zopfochytrium polystomum]|nr:hypothetical protein DFJ73DRAFT_802225 [Zopfochytrium polystomum]